MKSCSSVLRRFVHYPSCLERGITKKSSESLRGTHPQTFGFRTRSRPGKYFGSSFFFFVVVVFLFVFLFSLEIFQIKGLCCAVTDVRWIKRRELLNGAIVAVERKSEGGLGMSFFFFLLLSNCHTWVNVELRFTNWTGAWNKLRSPLPLPRNWISVVGSNPRDILKRIFVSKCGCHNICFSKWITRSFVCTYESSRQLYTQLKEHSSPEALKQSHSVNSNFRPVFNIPGSQSPDYLTRYVSIEG